MEQITRLSEDFLDRTKILRKARYRCEVCGGINHKEGYFSVSDTFIECDKLMRIWALANNLKLFRISLQIVKAPSPIESVCRLRNYVLCRKHSMQLKNRLRDLKKLNLNKSS